MDWITEFWEDGRQRLDRLLADVGDINMPPFTPEALLRLWSWVLPRLRERPAAEPFDAAAAPPWWGRRESYRPAHWDDTTLDRAGALAFHLGETYVQTVPGARWAYSDRKQDSEAGEAMVRLPDPEYWINPLVVVLNALKAAKHGTAGPSFLRDVYDNAVAAEAADAEPRMGGLRLSLRVVAPARGLLRRRTLLPGRLVEQHLQALLGEQVVLPAHGQWRRDYDAGAVPECRIELVVEQARGQARQVRALVRGAPEEHGSDQPALRHLLLALLDLAEVTGAVLEGQGEAAIDEEWRLRGRIDRQDVPLVLEKIAPTDET